NDALLEHFIATFYGSGNYSGDYWFVGMEEGGGNTLERVLLRLGAWRELGETELVDIYEFHIRINYPEYFNNPVKLQRTWMQQARIILASQGKPTSVEHVRAYQRDIIGRKSSETCLLELLPLPSPSTRVWNYGQWSNLSYLRNREVYRKYCIPWRCKHIHSRIRVNKPALVVFVGKSYYPYWQQVAGNHVKFREINGFMFGSSEETNLIISKHPATRGVSNAYFEEIGSFCSSRINL
ncbi:hypothetical protein JW887_03530, partial [Candidatus Dojkabacteria bacterium]|nr:hypothetical protein [Candidatus Dojkabacteria bacterium]